MPTDVRGRRRPSWQARAGLASAIGVLAWGATLGAQPPAIVLSLEDAGQRWPIARLVDGAWVGAAPCAADHAEPVPSGRLVIEGGLSVQPVHPVRPGSEEWLRLSPTILGLFDGREREARLVPSQTSVALTVVDWIYAADRPGVRQYYFEASRRVSSVTADVGLDTDPPGTSRVSVSGFLRQDADNVAAIGTKSEMRWEEDGIPAGPPSPDLMPLGILLDGDRAIWVMRGRSASLAWVALYDVGERGIRLILTTRTACRP